MSLNKRLKKLISIEINEYNKYFYDALKTDVRILDIINRYIVKRKGKELRPILTLLSAKICGSVNNSSFVASTFVQLLHTATLVHDDVVDNTKERRGFFSINALWGSKIAVLVGDFMLSRGMLLALKTKEYDLLEIVSESVKAMSEGELLQLEKARKLNQDEDIYFEIINKKTASLISACTSCGAKSANATEEQFLALKSYGENLGIAFQLKDDIFDYFKKGAIGKPTLNDLKEKKLTLPIIHVLKNIEKKERKNILNTISKYNNNKEKMQEIADFVIQNGGIEYTANKMDYYIDQSIECLNCFQDSDIKTALIELSEYNRYRKE